MQALCSKLKGSWTNIAHHLYLKADAPVPLPSVGPLAELLSVTRHVCKEVLTLAAAGSLEPADIAIALDTNTVRLLARLVQWLQAEPNEQLLLNTERSESLWQLLLLTLANLLRVLQPDHDTPADKALVDRFKQQLQASGVLGQLPTASDSSSSSTPAATPPATPPGLLAALRWLLQHHPHRCLSASMGAWLLLQELWVNTETPSSSSTSTGANGTTEPASSAAGGAADIAAAAVAGASSHFVVAHGLMPALGQLLQAYVDCAYRNVAQPPVLPVQQVPVGSSSSSGNSTGRNSNTGTPVRKVASREKVDSPVPGASTPSKRSSAAAGLAATAEDGSSSPAAGGAADVKAASEADSSLVLKGYVHAVCLIDDPSTPTFKHLLAHLHSLQIQLLVLAASLTAASSSSADAGVGAGSAKQQQAGVIELPYATHLQVLALANKWLSQHGAAASTSQGAAPATAGTLAPPAAGSIAGAIAVVVQHHAALQGLPPSIAGDAMSLAEMDDLSAVQQLVVLCASALQVDCFKSVQEPPQQQEHAATETAAVSTSSSGSGSCNGDSSSSSKVDPALVFKMLLESVCWQQACGAAVPGAPLEAAAIAAHCCTRPEVQLLLQQHGSQLLATLLRYIQQEPAQQQQQQQQQGLAQAGEEPGPDAAAGSSSGQGAGSAAELQMAAARRCVVCAQVFLEVCSVRRPGPAGLLMRSPVDEHLLGLLTETDPATFYTIMDTLVRRVHPDSLSLLLPMSACFLMHDMNSALEQRQQEQQQDPQQQSGQAQAAGMSTAMQQDPSSASTSSSSDITATASGTISSAAQVAAASRSMVILNDPDVCRTFAAALHGYCKTALAHLLQEGSEGGCSGACGHDHGHGHGHGHHEHHDHAHHINMGLLLFPMQQVAHWLMFSFDLNMSAMQEQTQQFAVDADGISATGTDTAAATASSSSKSEQLLAAVNLQAKQMQATSQAAAGSLVLTVLLARAAVPLLKWMQQEIQQLPAAAAAAGSSSSSSSNSAASAGDVAVPLATAANLWSSLGFLRNVWQVICARYCLAQLLEERLHQLLRASAQAAEAAAGLKKRAAGGTGASGSSSSSTGPAGADAAGKDSAAAAAQEAEHLVKGLRSAAAATSGALHGRGLARGWSHLAYVLPPDAVYSARTFQRTWPGDLFEACKAVPVLEAGRAKLRQAHESGSSSSGGTSSSDNVILPAAERQELLRLVSNAHTMVTRVLDDIPLPVGCNNPDCSRVEAVAEATLSINKRCSQCLAAHYCCKDCQVSHWPAHKTACKRLRQQPVSKAPTS